MKPATESFRLDPPTSPPSTRRTRIVARWFDLSFNEIPADESHDIAPPHVGEIVLLAGASGSGKSTLLRSLSNRVSDSTIDLNRLRLPNRPAVDVFNAGSIETRLAKLGEVGLAEAYTFLRRPAELSDGQRWRLKLALACDLASNADSKSILVADEFGALLDRITAKLVARVLRKLVDRDANKIGAIVATSHDDIERALRPDRVIRCDFGVARVIDNRSENAEEIQQQRRAQ